MSRHAARAAALQVTRVLPRAAAGVGALLGLSAPAWACPYCAVGQDTNTLAYILAFILLPYLIVSGVIFWMRRLLRSEHEDAS